MGLLSDIFGFIEDLASGGSYYKENSIEWCDKAWRRMRNAERGEARLYQIGIRFTDNYMLCLKMVWRDISRTQTTEGVIPKICISNVKTERSWNVLDIS